MWKHYLLGAAVSIAAGYLFLASVSPSQMLAAAASMNLWYLVPCLALYLGSYFFRALRWRYLMRPIAQVPLRPLFSALMIGFLGNNILPAHLGEVVRAYVLGRSQRVSKSATFATLVMERVFDGLTVLFFLLMVFLFMDLPQGEVEGTWLTTAKLRASGWLGLGFFLAILLVLQALRWQRRLALAVCGFLCRPLPPGLAARILRLADEFGDGLALTTLGGLMGIVLHSLLTWLFLGLWTWSLMPAFGLGLGPLYGILVQVLIALALLIPAAPAFVGTFHLAAAAGLVFLGADPGVAGSYAMVLWAVHFASTTLVGLFCLWREGMSLGSLAREV